MEPKDLQSFTTRAQADDLCFVLRAVGIPTRIRHERNADRGSSWVVGVAEQHWAEARRVAEEELSQAAAAVAPPLPAPRMRVASAMVIVLLTIVVHAAIWWAMERAGGSTRSEVLLRFGAAQQVAVAAGAWWRLFAAMTLHIGVGHLLSNMVALLVFAPSVLRTWGAARAGLIYVLAGLGGNVASQLLSGSAGVKAGASGAIFGLLGALAGRRVAQIREAQQSSRFKVWHVLASIAAFYGLTIGTGRTDHLAHIGGLVTGAVLGYLLREKKPA